MKHLFALLMLLASAVHAQTPTAPPPPPCYPLINGVHSAAPRLLNGEVGQHVFWFCSPRGGQALAYGFSCLHGQCSAAALHAAHVAVMQASAKLTAANAAWAANMQFNCDLVKAEQTPRGQLCRERDAMLKVLEAAR